MPGTVSSTSPGAHHRPRLELRRRDRALAGRGRDADEILGGVLDVGDVAERGRAGHDDVGVQRQRQHGVRGYRLRRLTTDYGAPQHG